MSFVLALLASPIFVVPQLPSANGNLESFGNVWVVEVNGGGDFTALQPAINAAQGGDTVLVKSGSYAGFNLLGKSMTIVGEARSNVECTTTSTVGSVPAGERVLLQNLVFRKTAGLAPDESLRLTNNAGGVRVEHCTIASQAFSSHQPLYISASSNVLLRACESRGAGSPNQQVFTPPAGHGGTALNSILAVYQSQFIGGNGGGGDVQVGGNGGDGWRQTGGELRTVLSTFQGGDGGESLDCQTGLGGDGGDGLALLSPLPILRRQSSTFLGGMRGLHACGYAGSDGDAITGGTSTTTTVSAPARTLSVPALVRDGTSVTFTLGGVVGDAVFLLVSAHDARMTSPAYEGVLFARGRYLLRVDLGTLTSTTATHTWSIPDELIPSGLSCTFTAQAVFQASAGGIVLSNPVTIVILDHLW